MKLKKQKQSINFKDGKFWYKLLAGIAVLGMILAIYLKEMIELGQFKVDVLNGFNVLDYTGLSLNDFKDQLNQTFGTNPKLNGVSIVPILKDSSGVYSVEELKVSAGFGEYTVQTFSFFTILSNLAVGIGFILAALKPHQEGKKGFINYESSLVVATTITITMLIGLGMLMPARIASGDELNWLYGFTGLCQHAAFPLLFIFYICFAGKPNHVGSQKEYMKKGGGKLIVVLLIYGIYALARGEMRYQGGRPYDTQYPYFFLRVHETKIAGMPGYAGFIIALTAIIGICLGFSIGYNALLNKKFATKSQKNRN